jgi:N-acyl-D-aspartate/D-glutamate deacylase
MMVSSRWVILPLFAFAMTAGATDSLDIVLRGGRVIDGSGTPSARVDVGLKAGRITAIGDLSRASARREIDVSGLIVAPGFIDVQWTAASICKCSRR